MNNTYKQNIAHDSANYHVSGSANYIDDIATPTNTLHVAFALSKVAHGKINNIDVSKAQKITGVRQILLAKDIKHLNIGAIIHDEPLLAHDKVLFYGQALCAILADSVEIARTAAKLVSADIQELEPIIDITDAIQKNSFLKEPITITNGDFNTAIKNSQHNITSTINIGGQEHFYLESQSAMAIPSAENEIVIHSSTQNPTEVQHLVAHVLELEQNSVEVITRRMGGGFGGKETDSSQLACICAIFAQQQQKTVKAKLPRYEDFLMTGKRHDYLANYQVGFNENGVINAINIDFYARCGYSLDLSNAIVYRTLFHADNCYYLENATFTGHLCKTNTVSNTAFRGFGGPQGMLAIESIIEDIANYLQQDSLTIRQNNFYREKDKNTTPYGQYIEDNIIKELTDELISSSNYKQRKNDIANFNKNNKHFKKGLALSPVKFGISFTTTFLNQAGALIHIYKDGSIYLNHGGTEMGQGLFTKISQVVAHEFGIDTKHVKVSATSTAKVPNTSATAASSGSDMNGMAAFAACKRIKQSLLKFAIEYFSADIKEINFQDNKVHWQNQSMDFKKFIELAYFNRTELFSNGFYKTPKIHFNEDKSHGRPFYYYAYGACVSEVVIDTITGEYKLLAVDILHDVGASLNLAIDKGQITGGFIQGMGWLCTEELKWSAKGELTTTGPATYKIPAIGDTPRHFQVDIKPNHSNHENTIYKSKAVGEPPIMLAISTWLAIKNAIFNTTNNNEIKLAVPASFEEVFFAINDNEQ